MCPLNLFLYFTWKVLCSEFAHAVIMVVRTTAKAYKENLLLQRAVLLFLNFRGGVNFQFTAFDVNIGYIVSPDPYREKTVTFTGYDLASPSC